MKCRIILTGLVLAFIKLPVTAQVVDRTQLAVSDTISDINDELMPGVTNIRLGLEPTISPDYDGSDDYNISIKPLISLQYRDLIQIDNNNIRINLFGDDGLFHSHNFKAGPLIKVDFGRSENDNASLAGMGDVGTSIELGLFASYPLDNLTRARMRLVQDTTSGHSGMKIMGDVRTILYKANSFTIIGSVISTWADNKYLDSYFSLNAVQSQRTGLPEFDAGSGIKDISLALSTNYSLTRHWDLLSNFGYTRLVGDAKKSPLVSIRGTADQFSAGFFAIYTF